MDVVAKASTHLVKGNTQLFAKVEEFLTEIKTILSAQSTISPESISQIVSNIETNIKVELDPIRRLVLRLLTNAPYVMHVSQGEKEELVRRRIQVIILELL